MDEIRIIVPFDIQRNSPNLRHHWAKRAGEAHLAFAAGRAAWLMAGRPRAAGPVVVSMIVRRPRRLDEQNAWAAAKNVMDGCFVNAVTRNDSPDYLSLGTVTQERCRKGEESVTFVITEREEAHGNG